MKYLIPKSWKRLYHFGWAVLSILLYGRPSKKMKIIGITGTDGKTTTTSLVYAGLKASGKKVAMINGVNFILPSKEWKNASDNSTPGRLTIRKFLKQAQKEGVEIVILEVTSWGLEQYRLFAIAFDVAVITNFAHEHLDLHKTMNRYRAMKGKLFKGLKSYKKEGQKKIAVINRDDDSFAYFNRFVSDETYSYSLKQEAVLKGDQLEQKPEIAFTLYHDGQSYPVELQLKGAFNASNALAAIGACLAVGAPMESVLKGMKELDRVPGRMEFIDHGQPFSVVVDFAHTAQAFEAIFASTRTMIGEGNKIIAVYGSAGGRDKGRRKMIGDLAGQMVDYSVLTTDDPRNEDPSKIADEIIKGLAIHHKKLGDDYEFIQDRAEAIAKGISLAKEGDAVLCLSMGAYEVMYVGAGKVEWSDAKAAKEGLEKAGYTV